MRDFRKDYPGRCCVEVWDVETLRRVQAFGVSGSEEHFWVPERGYSGTMGIHFFLEFELARARRIADLENELGRIKAELVRARFAVSDGVEARQ